MSDYNGIDGLYADMCRYFTYDEYAGISAFLRRDDTEEARNARMLSVGVLIPVEEGRIGKSFLCASELQELAR